MSAVQEMSVKTERQIGLFCKEILSQKSISMVNDSDDDHVSETTAFNIAGNDIDASKQPKATIISNNKAPTTAAAKSRNKCGWYSSDDNEQEMSISPQHMIQHEASKSENMILEMVQHSELINTKCHIKHESESEEMYVPTSAPLTVDDSSNRSSPEIINYRKSTRSKDSGYNFKITDIMTDFSFWARIFVLILSGFLLILAGSYCIGQIIEVKLDIITECDGNKTQEEIWQHSYDAYVKNEQIMSEESQFGWSDDSCWTTHKVDINTNQLWYYNQYKSQWTNKINAQCVFFGLLCVYLVCVIFYNITTLIIDFVAIKRGSFHTKSRLFANFIKTQQEEENGGDDQQTEINPNISMASKVTNLWNELNSKYLSKDTTGWIILKMVTEFTEFILQSQALLLYNGYNVSDPNNQNDVYLANKPQFIILFAAILSFNLFGSGLLWLFYALIPSRCYGLSFNQLLFFVDKFSDLLYTLFPFYVLLMDDYNKNTNDKFVILGQLQINSALAFFATFVPLLLLCSKLLFLIRSTRNEMFDKVFIAWSASNTLSEHHASKSPKSLRRMLSSNQYVPVAFDKDIHDEVSWINKDIYGKRKTTTHWKQILLVVISLLVIGYSILILIYTITHIESSKEYCGSVTEAKYIKNGTFMGNISLSELETQTLSDNPELYLWDKCLYKVYPFVNDDQYKCQCRVFVIDWENLKTTESERENHFNITQDKILNGAINDWYMLEKFHSFGSIPASQTIFTLESSMYKSVHMKAFDVRDVFISSIEYGISSWQKLEYLSFSHTSVSKTLPSDFGGLESVQYILFEDNGLKEIPSSICNLKDLKVLEITYEYFIQSLPHCISELNQLQAIWIEITQLSQIPLSIFSMPNLLELSLFNGDIDYQNLLNYNNLSNITNNTDSFRFNSNTRYWLTDNPICDEIASFPPNLQSLINDTCSHQCTNNNGFGAAFTDYCSPRLLGDGECTKGCQYRNCEWDQGDCVQLCFAEQLTNCTYDKLTNDKCDNGCNNEFCSEYAFGSDFTAINYDGYWDEEQQTLAANGPDFYQCPLDAFSFNFSIQACKSSESVYLDLIDIESSDYYRSCSANRIADGNCDDSCRTEECLYDRGDCEEGNGCQDGSFCGNIYQAWNALTSLSGSVGVYKFNHSWVCMVAWPVAAAFLGSDPGNCSEIIREDDYNNDGHTNFREFVVIQARFQDTIPALYKQINCSQCVGMEYYRI